jgi:hypothetical protein
VYYPEFSNYCRLNPKQCRHIKFKIKFRIPELFWNSKSTGLTYEKVQIFIGLSCNQSKKKQDTIYSFFDQILISHHPRHRPLSQSSILLFCPLSLLCAPFAAILSAIQLGREWTGLEWRYFLLIFNHHIVKCGFLNCHVLCLSIHNAVTNKEIIFNFAKNHSESVFNLFIFERPKRSIRSYRMIVSMTTTM